MKKGFTLAEVLITIGVIGIVSAIIAPTLITNIQERVRAEKIRTVKYKFTKATDKMKSLGLIGPYKSTDAFVDELQKHFKIAKRCGVNELRACWPYDNIKTTRGDFPVSDARNGNAFMMKSSDSKDYSSNTVGIITADGTPMLLNYNKKCESLDPDTTYAWVTSDGKPVTNATAGCVAAIFETNGTSGLNTFKNDVAAFNANGLNGDCAVGIGAGSSCFSAPFIPTPLTNAECEMQKNALGIKNCCTEYYCNRKDYWSGAVKHCGGVNNMPTRDDLGEIASLIYEGNPNIGGSTNKNGLIYNKMSSKLGLPEPDFTIWAGDGTRSDTGNCRDFNSTYTSSTERYRSGTWIYAMCKLN